MDKPSKPKNKPTMTLADVRKFRVMSARELADKAGVTASSVLRIESGSVPRYSTIRALSEALGVRPEDILWPGDPLGINDLPFPEEPPEQA